MSERDRDLLLQLVTQAAERRRESEQHFRAMIVAARANGLPLKAIANAAGLSAARIHAILEEEETMAFATPMRSSAPNATDRDVLVVAARVAYREYLTYHAYVCQPGRSFREVERMGFYRNGHIEPEFPVIRAIEDHIPFTLEHAATLRTTESAVNREIAALIERMLDDGVRSDIEVLKVFLLTPPGDPQTVTLAQGINHDSAGRGSAWTMGQRYANWEALRRARTTDEL
jgi:hypothetical protein